MKKIINSPESIVTEMCKGIVLAHPELEFLPKFKVIKKKKTIENKVSLISGGGSGHEPAHAGFVGKGMLDAAVCGDVFASPSQIQVYQAIKAVSGNKGTLLIIKNYSGDMMNFTNAMHLAKEDGHEVDYVIVDDDIAVKDSLYTVGRRGVAGTVFVHKIAGAAAESGLDLNAVKEVAKKTVANTRSIGFAFTSCTVPAKGTPTFTLNEDEMEYGVGIHGEPGIKREKILSADELADRMVTSLLNELSVKDNDGSEVAIIVNGFGATPIQELYLLNNSVYNVLKSRSVAIDRIFVGNFMTSIDMAGASISILKLDDELKALLSADSDTPGFKVSGTSETINATWESDSTVADEKVLYSVETPLEYSVIENNEVTLDNLIFVIDRMSEVIIANEVPFCDLDSHAGDGDFGMSVAKGFKQLKKEWKILTKEYATNIGDFLNACSLIIMEHCGGASGPIWGSAFRAAAKSAGDKQSLTLGEVAAMVQASVEGIQQTGKRSFGRGAVVGDKTLIDALIPFADSLKASADTNEQIISASNKAAAAAVKGAESTKDIVARMGRAGTVGERSLGYPDAGAHALGVIFTDIAESLK